MYKDQGAALGGFPAFPGEKPGSTGTEFERLVGTVISGINFNDNRLLEVEGRDRDGHLRWRVSVPGSARFTFSHSSPDRAWLVEANFDAGGLSRRSEQAMILAMCGAVVQSFRVEGGALFIRSDDARAIEVPAELNDDGIVIHILPDEAGGATTRIVVSAGSE